MTSISIARLQTALAGIWSGSVVAIGGIAAPALFMVLDKPMAGRGAGQIFSIEGKVSLFFAIVLFLLERKRTQNLADVSDAPVSAMTANVLLILGALFLTVLGQFALHPMIEAAKTGQPTLLSFGALHGLSASLYWLKAILLLKLFWRLTSTSPG